MRSRHLPGGAPLTKRVVDSLVPRQGRFDVWDSALPGFGVRIAPSGAKSFILRYRPKHAGRTGPKRFMTIGRFGPLTVDQARERAKRIFGRVADGQDPAATLAETRAAPRLADIVPLFLAEHVQLKRKANTVGSYTRALTKHVLPALGRKRLEEITRSDIAKMHNAMVETPYVANYAVAALGSLFTWACRRGLVPDGFNPTRRLERFKESRRERFLTSEELLRLGAALREAETTGVPWVVDVSKPTAKHIPKAQKRITVVSTFATAAIRLLLFTGCRLREILGLRWEHVDFERQVLFLPDSKTGRKTVLLGPPALRVLTDLPRGGAYVIAGSDPDKVRTDLKRPWAAIRRRAGLNGVRIHDLRHSYASVGAGAGLGLPVIGRLLGHTQPSTTARYAHLADDPLRRASDTIASTIAAAMGEATASDVAMGFPKQQRSF
jgi:integrase